MFVPGYAFMPDPNEPSPHVRASFSIATPEQMDKVSGFFSHYGQIMVAVAPDQLCLNNY